MRVWQAVILGESLLGVAVWAAHPWLVSTMTHDPASEARRTAAVEARSRLYQKHEAARQQSTRLPPSAAEAMVEERERSVRKAIDSARRDLETIAREAREQRERVEQELLDRSPHDLVAPRLPRLRKEVADLARQADVLKNDATDSSRQEQLAQQIDELAAMIERLAEAPAESLEHLTAAVASLREQAAELRHIQEAAQGNPAESAAVGLPGHTAWLQERVAEFAAQLDDIAAHMPGQGDPLTGLSPKNPLPATPTAGGLAAAAKHLEQLARQIATDHEAVSRIGVAMQRGLGVNATPAGTSAVTPAPSLGPRPVGGQTTIGDVAAYGRHLNTLSRWASQTVARAAVRAGGGPGGTAGGRGGQGRGEGSGGEGGRGRPTGQPGNGGGQGGRGGQGSDGGFAVSRYRGRGGSGMAAGGASKRSMPIDVSRARREALPGRRFTAESSRAGWLFLDSWYCIGPWGNRGKIDFSVLHPPECEIDLEAEYLDGKAGANGRPRLLRWTFVQGDDLRIVPLDETADATYYAWTEVFSDRPRTVQVAIASDDAAKVWVNGRLVWEDEGQSAWNLDEGIREVPLREGFNDVLIRIENGPDLCTFSVVLCPRQEEP